MLTEGFLVISDITGYSAYLNESELEHAKESLTDLINVLIEHTRSPLVISKLEGDAVFSYAPKGGFRSGQTLLEMIETTYLAFRKALELMVINTTCTCKACRNIPNLDLKFFIHFGAYSIQQMGEFQELVGNDVVLVHRMLKNTITEETGLKAYAAYCQDVIDILNMEEMAGNMLRHEETLADVGKVDLYVQDLHGIWEERKDEVRIEVHPEEAAYTWEVEFDIPQAVLWDFVTKPEYRNILYGSDDQRVRELSNGRINPGAAYVCAHGNSESTHTILDWQPFDQYTTREESGPPLHLTFTATYRFSTTEGGSRLQAIVSRPIGSRLRLAVLNPVITLLVKSGYVQQQNHKNAIVLVERIAEEIESGDTVLQPSIEFGNELAAKAAAESLAGNATSGGQRGIQQP